MSQYALIAILDPQHGIEQGATRELENLDAVFDAIRELVEGGYKWNALTLVHIEDLPLLSQDFVFHDPPTA